MDQHFEYELGQQVTGFDSISGFVTHCGVDAGGVIYLVQWRSETGAANTHWYRASELN